MDKIYIQKASGEREPFKPEKLRRSLKRSGADKNTIESIIKHIEAELLKKKFFTTKDIYKHAFSLLRKESKKIAAKYSLKKAIMEFGPDGFPFEILISEIFKKEGYKTTVGAILKGGCVNHEVDVLAEKDNTHIFIECKFHNSQGIKTDLKVALYVQARFEDLQKYHLRRAKRENRTPKIHSAWLATNTKLTSLAINYSRCVGLNVIGWDYPKSNSLRDLIVKYNLHPITSLFSLNKYQKNLLLRHEKIVLCKDILNNPNLLKKIGLNQKGIQRTLNEVREIINNQV